MQKKSDDESGSEESSEEESSEEESSEEDSSDEKKAKKKVSKKKVHSVTEYRDDTHTLIVHVIPKACSLPPALNKNIMLIIQPLEMD